VRGFWKVQKYFELIIWVRERNQQIPKETRCCTLFSEGVLLRKSQKYFELMILVRETIS
jgi:hypothetical protein